MKFRLLLILFFFSLSSICLAQENKFENWKKERELEITKEDGWLNLVGLLAIDEQKAYLNELPNDSLVISDQSNKRTIGTFQFLNDSVWFLFNPKISKQKSLVYPLEYGKGGGVYYKHWKWLVIHRGGQYSLRLRDLEHPAVKNFEPLPYFDYNPKFRVKAFFEPKFNQTMNVPNVLGQVIEWKVMGILKFELDGKPMELTVLDELGKFFLIFSDLTNEQETYPTGRYMYIDYPDRTGNTVIDFNFSYNPPCAFTAFATCPIPPKENRMEVRIEAGEKMPNSY
ncbi:hypothetical protein DFQ04_0727 [Algoriphagus boseongensis]|uniref:DUF1684 domain-containing protein n=1 Tax=Algoriphagus boseongensis TaxID=1442587 RepID=A0A4R6T888_9BACT|nr:DUF1684 domain-containing protein [Algoriphagus boseongensis]TDQ18916.1 hypothetical protein DFQ04_0727 [Algoriphagus boseongensis]